MADAAVNISHVMEEHSLDVAANQGKSEFHIVEEQSIPTQWETSRLIRLPADNRGCTNITRTSLIEWKRPQGISAPPEKAFGKWHRYLIAEPSRRSERRDYSELRLAGQHNGFRKRIISCISYQHATEAPLRPKVLVRRAKIHRRVHTVMRIRWIVPAVMNKGR